MLYKLDVSSIEVLWSPKAGIPLDAIPALGDNFLRLSLLVSPSGHSKTPNPSLNPSPF